MDDLNTNISSLQLSESTSRAESPTNQANSSMPTKSSPTTKDTTMLARSTEDNSPPTPASTIDTKDTVTDEDCPICYEPITEAKKVVCGHTFCDGCITKWLARKYHCPICRTELRPRPEGQGYDASDGGSEDLDDVEEEEDEFGDYLEDDEFGEYEDDDFSDADDLNDFYDPADRALLSLRYGRTIFPAGALTSRSTEDGAREELETRREQQQE